jgi:hypothetical protein
LAAIVINLVPVIVESLLPGPGVVRVELNRLPVFNLDADSNNQTGETTE